MNVGECISRLKEFNSVARQLLCTCCGQVTPVQGSYGFCCWCESLVYRELAEAEGLDHVRVERMGAARGLVKERDYDGALRAYEELWDAYQEPGILYVQALVLMEGSNGETGSVSYDREGFMEENSAHRERAASLYSGARLRLYRALSLAQAHVAAGENMQEQFHAAFLCQVKLGRFGAAEHTIEAVERLGDSQLSDYERVVLGCALRDFEGAAGIAERLADRSGAALNSFYYLGWLWYKRGRLGDAKRLGEALEKVVPESAAVGLGAALEEALAGS